MIVTLIHRQPKQLNRKSKAVKTYVSVNVVTLVTIPKGTCLVLVLVTWGAVTVTTEALAMPLKTVTGAGVLVAVAVVTAADF